MPRTLSLATIRARIRALELKAKKLEYKEKAGVADVARLIRKFGLSRADCERAFALSRKRGGRAGASPIAGRKIEPKYRDSKGNTWTGRGRAPLWLVAAEKAGKSRDSFLIKK